MLGNSKVLELFSDNSFIPHRSFLKPVQGVLGVFYLVVLFCFGFFGFLAGVWREIGVFRFVLFCF